MSTRFALRWLDAGRLALGPAPHNLAHLQRLQQEGIVAVLSLCSTLEAPPPPQQLRAVVSRLGPLHARCTCAARVPV